MHLENALRPSFGGRLGSLLLVLSLIGTPSPTWCQEEGVELKGLWGMTAGALMPLGGMAEIANLGYSLGFVAGYHLHPLLRVDGYFDAGFSGSSTTHPIQTTRGERQVQLGGQFFVRAGPSLVFPWGGRFLVSVGGGVAYAWYRERLEGYDDKYIVWPSQSRRGPGGYLALIVERMDTVKGHQVGMGLSLTVYSVRTDGDPLHGLFEGETEDRWVALCLTLGWHS